jgi:hypothetical protein
MIGYASAVGKGRNLETIKRLGFGLLISRRDVRSTHGLRYCLDNGAWGDHLAGEAFDEDAFERMVDRLGPGADWVVLPDIVAGGLESLALSLRWSNRCMASCDLVLIAVQDGMEPADLAPYVGPRVGIFLGGSTEWKLARMRDWGEFCAAAGCWYHVARVNTARRFRMAHYAGATSIDGSSLSRFSATAGLVDGAIRQPDLFPPERAAA